LDPAAREAIRIDPALVLSGAPPQLVDEWQLEATTVWNHVSDAVNRRGVPGQFVLTGSAVPDDDAARHTGAGRIARLSMRPMSLYESGDSTGDMSLAALLSGQRPTTPVTALTIPAIVDLVARGGWPMNLDLSTSAATRANRDYLKNISEVDVVRVDPARNDPQRAMRLLRALARNVAMDHKVARLANETDREGPPLARTTAYDYLSAFDRLMVTEAQPAWSTHLRSRATLRVAARTHFIDPSLAVAALAANPESLLADLNAFGYLFESLVVRDCRVYSDPLEGSVFHYRDSDDLEVDVIVVSGKAWGAFEVKLGVAQVDQAAANLRTFANKVDTSKVDQPAVLGVITGTGYGYTRPDGVVVVPVGALGP
jgi:predicted AAA+ superfamily ATPase